LSHPITSLLSVSTKMTLDVVMPFTTISGYVEMVVKGIKPVA
jgi:hypothetical protein